MPVTDQDRIAELLVDFPVTVEIPVAWGDMDAMGHVNNAVYFRYFETARIKCFAELGLDSIEQSDGVGPILHSASCRFRIPPTHPDTVTVGAQIAETQATTEKAVSAIGTIGTTISRLSEISTAVAAAVEEQSAVTQEMSNNMQSAAAGVASISRSVGEIATATRLIDEATTKVREASRSLA